MYRAGDFEDFAHQFQDDPDYRSFIIGGTAAAAAGGSLVLNTASRGYRAVKRYLTNEDTVTYDYPETPQQRKRPRSRSTPLRKLKRSLNTAPQAASTKRRKVTFAATKRAAAKSMPRYSYKRRRAFPQGVKRFKRRYRSRARRPYRRVYAARSKAFRKFRRGARRYRSRRARFPIWGQSKFLGLLGQEYNFLDEDNYCLNRYEDNAQNVCSWFSDCTLDATEYDRFLTLASGSTITTLDSSYQCFLKRLSTVYHIRNNSNVEGKLTVYVLYPKRAIFNSTDYKGLDPTYINQAVSDAGTIPNTFGWNYKNRDVNIMQCKNITNSFSVRVVFNGYMEPGHSKTIRIKCRPRMMSKDKWGVSDTEQVADTQGLFKGQPVILFKVSGSLVSNNTLNTVTMNNTDLQPMYSSYSFLINKKQSACLIRPMVDTQGRKLTGYSASYATGPVTAETQYNPTDATKETTGV